MNEGVNELLGKSQQWVRRYLVCENTQTNTCFFCFCICNQGKDFWCVLSELFLQTNWRPTSNPTCYRVAIHKFVRSFSHNMYIYYDTYFCSLNLPTLINSQYKFTYENKYFITALIIFFICFVAFIRFLTDKKRFLLLFKRLKIKIKKFEGNTL